MAILSNLLGSGDGENSSDLLGALTGVAGLDVSAQNFNQEIDEDGSSETSFQSLDIGGDLDIGGILSSMTDSMNDGDGLFG